MFQTYSGITPEESAVYSLGHNPIIRHVCFLFHDYYLRCFPPSRGLIVHSNNGLQLVPLWMASVRLMNLKA